MNTTLYIQTNMNDEVNRAKVRLSDMAHVVCEDKETENRCKELCVIDLSNKKPGSYVITALDLVRAVKSMDNDIEVTHMGEAGMILDYNPNPKQPGIWAWVKTIFVCLIVFFGAGFSIMTFNTDVSTRELFANLYQEVTGQVSNGFTEMELMYSLGIGVGVIFFFNHFNFKKKKNDPSALEVKMCTYKKDIATTVLDQESKGNRGAG